MYRVNVGNMTIDVVRKDIKNLHLAVYPPKGRVRIAAPLYMNEEAIRLYVVSKMSWIKRQQRKFLEQDRETEREHVLRESHFLFGKRYLLNVIEYDGFAKVVLRKNNIDLYVRNGARQSDKQTIMNEWYRKEIKKLIPEILKKWEKIIDVSATWWRVKKMKTKWGSCNRGKKRIWINLELSKKPIICLEYIIVHELVHLLERHHNDDFLRYMDSFMPQWRSYKDELNRFPVSHSNWSY